MRIAICSSAGHTTPPVGYGSEVTAWYMVEELNRLGHEVYLFAAEGSRAPANGKLFPMPLDLMGCTQSERHLVPDFLSALNECDIVHDMSSSHAFADATHLHGHDRHLTTINGISFVTPEYKHNVVVLSEAARQAALNGTPAWGEDYPQYRADPGRLPNCEVVHYGTDTDFYVPAEHRAFPGYILFVGRPHPSKGVAQILDLAKWAPHRRFLLAWRAEYEEHQQFEAQYRAQAQGLRNVEFCVLPEQSHHEVKRALYQQALAFLQISQYIEAFGLTAIEAMACGTPVILEHRGSAPEIVIPESTGFLCTSRSEYLRAIDRVVHVSRLSCRAAAVDRFSARVMAQRYLTLYDRILRGEQW